MSPMPQVDMSVDRKSVLLYLPQDMVLRMSARAAKRWAKDQAKTSRGVPLLVGTRALARSVLDALDAARKRKPQPEPEEDPDTDPAPGEQEGPQEEPEVEEDPETPDREEDEPVRAARPAREELEPTHA